MGTHYLMKMNLFPPEASDSGPRCWGQPAMFFHEGSLEKWMQHFTSTQGGNTEGNYAQYSRKFKSLSRRDQNTAAGGVWPPLVGLAHLLLMAPVPVLTEGNREPDRTGRVARVMTWSSINSKPGAMIFRDKPKETHQVISSPKVSQRLQDTKEGTPEGPIKGGQEGRLHPMGTRTNSMSPRRAALCPVSQAEPLYYSPPDPPLLPTLSSPNTP